MHLRYIFMVGGDEVWKLGPYSIWSTKMRWPYGLFERLLGEGCHTIVFNFEGPPRYMGTLELHPCMRFQAFLLSHQAQKMYLE